MQMIPLDEARWKELNGWYQRPYDTSSSLQRLEQGENALHELWNELHRQISVGEASYATVPHLVRIARGAAARDWNLYSLVATIEIERHRKTNPPLRTWIEKRYRNAWKDLTGLALSALRKI